MDRKCTIPLCNRTIKARGLCQAHYQRQVAGADMDNPIADRQPAKSVVCRIAGCLQQCWAKGLCRLHDARARKGMPEEFLSLPVNYRRDSPVGWIHKGYKWITRKDGKEMMEHRYLMEEHISRELAYDEVVHHINGNKLDNRIENLEIMDRDKHTSHHRAHQTPCKICGQLKPRGDGKGYEGALGLCAKHYYLHRAGKLT